MEGSKQFSTPGGSSSGDERKGRRGKGSKTKSTERYRIKANDKFQKDFNTNLANKLLALGATAEDLFSITKMDPISMPDQKIELGLSKFDEVCESVVTSLYAYGMAPKNDVVDSVDYDTWTLKFTLSLQIEAKMFAAQKDARFEKDMFDYALVDRTRLRLSTNFVPICAYLLNIGVCVVEGQRFIPSVGQGMPTYSKLRTVMQGALNQPHGKIKTSLISPLNPLQNVWVEILQPNQARELQLIDDNGNLTPIFYERHIPILMEGSVIQICQPDDAVPSFDEIVRRFEDLVTRASRKLPRCTAPVNLIDGIGSAAQIVGYYSIDGTERYRVWSPRRIPDDALEIGGIFQYASDQPLLHIDCAMISSEIETGGCLQILASKLR